MSNFATFPNKNKVRSNSTIHIDDEAGTTTLSMHPSPRPSFNPDLLSEIEAWRDDLATRVNTDIANHGRSNIRYAVLTSALPDVFNFGGDLNHFIERIRAGDRQGLADYAHACIRCTHGFSIGFGVPVISIALVEGRAQGGGFEAALAANVLIAEKGTQMGFPEVLFNLFPGMGAYSFLSRKVSPAIAERLILGGNLYEAEELYDMGVVDVLAEPGQGREALRNYIRTADKRDNVHGLMRRIRTTRNQVPYEELSEITELWVDSAMQLTERELRTMARLVRAQDRRVDDEQRQAN